VGVFEVWETSFILFFRVKALRWASLRNLEGRPVVEGGRSELQPQRHVWFMSGKYLLCPESQLRFVRKVFLPCSFAHLFGGGKGDGHDSAKEDHADAVANDPLPEEGLVGEGGESPHSVNEGQGEHDPVKEAVEHCSGFWAGVHGFKGEGPDPWVFDPRTFAVDDFPEKGVGAAISDTFGEGVFGCYFVEALGVDLGDLEGDAGRPAWHVDGRAPVFHAVLSATALVEPFWFFLQLDITVDAICIFHGDSFEVMIPESESFAHPDFLVG
jgi:hypothetical protein